MFLRGVVLAGGTGSRLMPLTKVTNKHLLPVGKKPMIYYPIEKLRGIGIEEILDCYRSRTYGGCCESFGFRHKFWLPLYL